MKKELSGKQRTTARFAIIGAVVLSMLIPLAMVEGVSDERQSFFDMTLLDIANSWGSAQNLAGPFLIVPEEHSYPTISEDGDLIRQKRIYHRVYLPARLRLAVDVEHQFRKRSIYEVPVYSARVHVEGEFPAIDAASRSGVVIRLDQARLVSGISDTQAISSASALRFGNSELAFRSGSGQAWIGSGVHAPVENYDGSGRQFQFDLQLKGSRQIGFTLVGDSTEVQMTSTWPHPSFNGTYLPERYEVRDDGFSAEWMVHELARDLPGSWRIDERDVQLDDSFAWVSLFQPVTEYTIVDRAIKYGLLFIALTFLGFVCFELTSELRFHPVQYGVIGSGLVLFYLALLSLSEHMDFGLSYLISTTLLTVLIGWYVWAMTSQLRLVSWMGAIVALLYGTLYVLLQLEAFALLAGTAVLLVGLVALMASTRSLTGRSGLIEPTAAGST